MSFVRAPNPIWYMVDHIGQALNDEYFAFFLTNTLPYLPQNVYRDPQGLTVWTGDVIQFSPAGTLPDNLYFDPNLVYRIEIRHGNSQTDELIWEINNFVPVGSSNIVTNEQILSTENQITNPQFIDISFVSPLTISAAGTYEVGPGWELVLTGTGSTTLTQLIFTGVDNTGNPPGNPVPPYALQINNSGWTEAFLRQRFNGNGALFDNGAITMSATARAEVSPELINLIYSPENPPGTPLAPIATATLGTGNYQIVAGVANVGQSTNSNLNDVSYVDMIIELPPTGIVDISNVQFMGQTVPLINPTTAIVPSFQQETNERQEDHLFHVYANQLITRPKKNILTGWNFALNPFQFVTAGLATKVAKTLYIADQTILHQETGSSVQTGRSGANSDFGLEIKAINGVNDNRFAIFQYIDPKTIFPYWGYNLSCLARVMIFGSHGTAVRLKARLIYRSDLPPAISNTEPITGWDANGDLTFAAGWTALNPINDPDYTLSYFFDPIDGENAFPALSFNSFALPKGPTDTPNVMTVGLVLYTMDDMNNTLGTEDAIVFDKVSLVPNLFAVEASPQTFDECLRECEFYYEKSYAQGTLPGSVTNTGDRTAPMRISYTDNKLYTSSFELIFNSEKRANPTLKFWTPPGVANNLETGILKDASYSAGSPVNIASSVFTEIGKTTKSVYMQCNDTSTARVNGDGSAGNEGILVYQYTADARLGI